MKKVKFLFVVSLILFATSNAQDMRQNSYNSLFSDQKANRIGDAITIIVLESSQASNNASTSAGRESKLGFSGSGSLDQTLLPKANLSIGSQNDFSGSGSTKTTGLIKTKISASIDSIYANGNMRITGSKKISINGEDQIIIVKGIVRPSDIYADNTVLSYNISDADITFEGSGIIDNAQHSGWLTKLFHWLF
ncbi:MAG: flagellar basal body L-ring protein [Ignavibacteriales bacterium CG_4_9_14_3_um_filter_34_10]|nr:MAG: flagellar basal body L-ring protein [Ignavibacteriales bacterium CG_4_9_14_3_um_filter_34_10]